MQQPCFTAILHLLKSQHCRDKVLRSVDESIPNSSHQLLMGCVVQSIQRILQSEDCELQVGAMVRSKVSLQHTLVKVRGMSAAAGLCSQYV